MDASMFSGVFAAMSTGKKLDIVANNLANVNTIGFKRSNVTFEDTMTRFAYDDMRQPVSYVQEKELFPEAKNMARVRIVGAYLQMEQGGLQKTGNPLDVAIQGSGFFKISGPEGTMYSRAGSFTKNEQGQLVTKDGFPVLGTGGIIAIPAEAKHLTIDEEGRVVADQVEIGQLDIVNVDTSSLKQFGQNLFTSEGTAVETPSNAILEQGMVEVSNVNAVREMVSLIEVQRLFEAYQKVMQTSDSISRTTITQVGRAV